MTTGTILFNPFTGQPRHPSDIASDPKGLLIWDGEEPLRAAQPSQARELPKHPVALSRDDTEHGVYYYKASEVDAIIAAINAKEQQT